MPDFLANGLSLDSSHRKRVTWLTAYAGCRIGCTHKSKTHTDLLSSPAVMEITVYLILNTSRDLNVSEWPRVKRLQEPKCVIKAAVGEHKYQAFLNTCAFLLCHSLSHTRRTSPLPYQPHLSQSGPDFPLQLLIKTFQDCHTWSGF